MPLQAYVLLVLSCLWVTSVAHAGLYKWVDQDGRTHFSDRPASQGPSEQVTIQTQPVVSDDSTSEAMATEQPEPGSADKPGKKPVDIVMYATQTCGYCRKARALFSERGVAWREVDIESTTQARQEFKDRGGQGVPLIFINGRTIRGFNEVQLRSTLGQYGY